MGDFIRLQHGAPPWEGSGHPDHHVETYHFHDIPLIGLIRQDGVNYLFRCLAGQVEPFNLWSYTLIEPSEIAALEAVSDVREFDEHVMRVALRPGVVAASIDGFGIVASRQVYDWSDPHGYLEPLFEEIRAFGQRLQDDVEAHRSRLVPAG